MVALSNIPFAIYNNIIVLGCLWLVYQIIATYLKASPSRLFVLAVVFQLSATSKFLWDVFIPVTPISLFHSFEIIKFPDLLKQSNNVIIFIGAAYCIAFFVLLVNLVIQYIKLAHVRSTANYSRSNEWDQLLLDIPNKVNSKIKIGTSALIESPIVFGYLEPIILLPISICTQLNASQIKLILVHELAHILRQDYLLNWFSEMAKIILWFNPFVYLMHTAMHLQRELTCDEFVMNHTQEPIAYSKALYELAKRKHLQQIQLSMGVMHSQHELLYRIHKINKVQFNPQRVKAYPIVIVMVILLIATTLVPIKNSTHPILATTHLVYSSTKANITKNQNFSASKNIAHPVSKKKKTMNVPDEIAEPSFQFTSTDNNKELSYNNILNETKQWIKTHENPAQFASYNSLNDSIENRIAERLLISAILKNYQLKKALLEKRLEVATDANEAKDFILNSSEWADMVQYEKWVQTFLNRQQ